MSDSKKDPITDSKGTSSLILQKTTANAKLINNIITILDHGKISTNFICSFLVVNKSCTKDITAVEMSVAIAQPIIPKAKKKGMFKATFIASEQSEEKKMNFVFPEAFNNSPQ